MRACAILVGVAALLWALSDAVLIIFLAILLATLLRGLGQELVRFTRMNVTVAVLLVSLALVVLVCGLSWWVGPKFVGEAQQLWGQLSQRFGSVRQMMGGVGLGGGKSGHASVVPHMVELVASSTLSFVSACW